MTNLTETKVLNEVAGTTFEGWVNFGTKDQKYVYPQTLIGKKDSYLIDNKPVENTTAWEFIYSCALEIEHGAGKAFMNLNHLDQMFASKGIVK